MPPAYTLEDVRPKSLDAVILPPNIRQDFTALLASPVRFVLFIGPSGSGKTTLARLLLSALNADVTEVNAASKDRGIAAMRSIVSTFDVNSLMGEVKGYLFEEIHGLTRDAREALLTHLEQLKTDTIVVGTTTEPNALDEALLSRAKKIYLPRVDAAQIEAHIAAWFASIPDGMGHARIIAQSCGGNMRVAVVAALSVLSGGSPTCVAPDYTSWDVESLMLPIVLYSLPEVGARYVAQIIGHNEAYAFVHGCVKSAVKSSAAYNAKAMFADIEAYLRNLADPSHFEKLPSSVKRLFTTSQVQVHLMKEAITILSRLYRHPLYNPNSPVPLTLGQVESILLELIVA